MPEANPFAPPNAEVADMPQVEASPALWNPGAAASWSLLLSPIFGSYLHTRNWEALGQKEKAAKSKNWMIGSIIFFVVLVLTSFVLPDSKGMDALGRLGGFALLIAWYYSIGKSQQAFVAARFGKTYPRRGWSKPLLAALGVFVAFLVVMFLLGVLLAATSSAA